MDPAHPSANDVEQLLAAARGMNEAANDRLQVEAKIANELARLDGLAAELVDRYCRSLFARSVGSQRLYVDGEEWWLVLPFGNHRVSNYVKGYDEGTDHYQVRVYHLERREMNRARSTAPVSYSDDSEFPPTDDPYTFLDVGSSVARSVEDIASLALRGPHYNRSMDSRRDYIAADAWYEAPAYPDQVTGLAAHLERRLRALGASWAP